MVKLNTKYAELLAAAKAAKKNHGNKPAAKEAPKAE